MSCSCGFEGCENPYHVSDERRQEFIDHEDDTFTSAVNEVGDFAREYTAFGDSVFDHWKQYAWQEGHDAHAPKIVELRAENAELRRALELAKEQS